MHVGLGLNLGLGLGTGGVIRQDPADWPALKFWGKFNEGTGTAITDLTGNVTDLAITANGAPPNDPWATPGAIQTYRESGKEVIVRTTGQAPAALKGPGDNYMVVLVDMEMVDAVAASAVFGVGLSTSTTTRGWQLNWNHSSQRLDLGFANASTNSMTTLFTSMPTLVATRRQLVYVLRRPAESGDPTEVDLYIGGTLFGSSITRDGSLNNVNVGTVAAQNNTNSKLAIGISGLASATSPVNLKMYNACIFYPATNPESLDMLAVAEQWASNSDRLPAALKGVS